MSIKTLLIITFTIICTVVVLSHFNNPLDKYYDNDSTLIKSSQNKNNLKDDLLIQIQNHERHSTNAIISLTAIFFTIIGLIGYGGYKQILKQIGSELEKSISPKITNRSKIEQGTIFNEMAYFHYLEWSGSSDKNKDYLLNLAITAIDLAFKAIDKINIEDYTKDHRYIIYQIFNNYVYFYSCRADQNDLRKTLEIAYRLQYLYKNNAFDETYEFKDTYAFALYKYGNNVQRDSAYDIAESIVKDLELIEPDRAKQIKDAWFKRKDSLKNKSEEEIQQFFSSSKVC